MISYRTSMSIVGLKVSDDILLSHPCMSTPYIPLQIPNYIKARHSHQSGGRSTTHTSAVSDDRSATWLVWDPIRSTPSSFDAKSNIPQPPDLMECSEFHACIPSPGLFIVWFVPVDHARHLFFLTLQYISFFFIFGIIWKLLLTKYSTTYIEFELVHRFCNTPSCLSACWL